MWIPVCIVMIIVIFATTSVYFVKTRKHSQDDFVSQRAYDMTAKAMELFTDGGGDASYSNYKNKVPGADPVQYYDVRRLYKQGRLTPHAVERIL